MSNKTNQETFQEQLSEELKSYLAVEKEKYPSDELLKIDLHCHDYNSDVPDELLGRILNVPETWLPTEQLLKTLKRNNTTAITVTNHNNARSCFDLLDQGKDVLVGAEFSCMVPDFNIGIHVLTYGFTKDQEKTLNKLRRNVYQFLQFTKENNLPTIWAHPLYHYNVNKQPNFDFFNKMVLLFERFEVLNGQRDTWQNMLVKNWIENLTPEKIDHDANYFNIDIDLYCNDRYKKSLSGGSDSHMGIFSGQTGTYLHIPNLKERLKTEKPSQLTLEAIRNGAMAPYGTHQNSEKLTVAFLDYVCQIAMYKKDPGMMRIMLHKGSFNEKLLAFFVTNAFSEVRRHKVTMRFVELFHNCFLGKTPSKSKRLLIPKEYKPIFDEASKISKAHELGEEQMIQSIDQSIHKIYNSLIQILFNRVNKKIDSLISSGKLDNINWLDLIEKLELPSTVRHYTSSKKDKKAKKNKTPNLSKVLDGLPFPFFASSLILSAQFTSSKVLYNNRALLNDFSSRIGKFTHPKRMLWLTDTFDDNNGISSFLQQLHSEVKRLDLPIDFLVCSNTIQPDKNLIVVKPLSEFTLPFYKEQSVRIPNLNEIQQLFLANEYDRIMCSTEGVMGICSLYLKQAFSVPANFYIHTDWTMFARKVMNADAQNIDRIRRILRTFYKGFDQLFVLNSDHQKWLASKEMEFDPQAIKLTAHWSNENYHPKDVTKEITFGFKKTDKVLLFTGRLSQEKGCLDLIPIFKNVQKCHPNLRLVFAGTGPLEETLKKELPEATFLGWVNKSRLPYIYSAADLLLLPSKFDTFSCVVLEALSCGLPVIAYKSKGPKDIINHGENGYLANGKNEMVKYILSYFDNEEFHQSFKEKALKRADVYNKNIIIEKLLKDLDLDSEMKHEHLEIVETNDTSYVASPVMEV